MPDEKELAEQIKNLAERMESMEDSISVVTGPYSQLLEYIERFQRLSSSYFRLLELYQRHGAISPDIIIPEVKDSISREVVKVLFERDGQNISQITEKVKERRGTASRRIVRERLSRLEELGVVRAKGSSRSKEYWLTEGYVRKWYEVLGLGTKETSKEEHRPKREG